MAMNVDIDCALFRAIQLFKEPSELLDIHISFNCCYSLSTKKKADFDEQLPAIVVTPR